jgi:hypothetical protein
MASALDRLQRQFSTQRRQSVASSTSPSRDFRPAGVKPAIEKEDWRESQRPGIFIVKDDAAAIFSSSTNVIDINIMQS